MTDKLKYNTEQRREYLNMIDRVGGHWLGVFGGNEVFYSAQYWDLFTRIWRSDGPVTKTDALRCMTGVKSAHTAGKYLETAIREGLLIEQENPEDKRSRIIVLAPVMKQRLDRFFDGAVSEVRQANRTFDVLGPSPEEP
jgi:hypothetical protein